MLSVVLSILITQLGKTGYKLLRYMYRCIQLKSTTHSETRGISNLFIKSKFKLR